MNIEDLKTLILTANRQALCDAMAPLSEQQRAALFPDAVILCRIVEHGIGPGKALDEPIGIENVDGFDADFLKQLRAASYPDWRCPRWTTSLMMLALGDEKFIRNPFKYDCRWFGSDLRNMPQRVLEVLAARQPKWLPTFIRQNTKEEVPEIGWTVEYGLIRSGALPANNSEDFYRRMAMAPLLSEHYASDAVKDDTLPPRPKTLADYLRTDQHLMESEIWKLFEFDAGAFNFSHSPWFPAFVTLCREGDIDRARLLEATAKALSGSARPKELAGYGHLHEMLEPTLEERETVIDHYLASLHSQHSAVVGTALTALEKLAKAKRLDPDALLKNCEDALQLSQKSPVVKTIRLIRTLVQQQKAVTGYATEVLAIAVRHERPDVQEAALKELHSLRMSFTDLTRERLRAAEPAIASVHAARLAELHGTETESPGADQTSNPDSAKKSAKNKAAVKAFSERGTVSTEANAALVAALQKRAESLSAQMRDATGADRALAAITSGTHRFVASIRPGHVPRRDPGQTVQPITSLEELIDTVASVIERVDDAMDIERVIDGIALFGQERPQDFEERISPLRKRIQKLDQPYSRNVIDLGAEIGFSQLLAAWLNMEPIRRNHDSWHNIDGLLFRQRCREIIEDWKMKRKPRRLLALPTHAGGWVDPEVLVERLRDYYLTARRITGNADIAQALLRLPPDGRNRALSTLKKLPGDDSTHSVYGGGPELLYALGEDSDFGRDPGYTWVYRRHSAAIHSRLLIEGDDFHPHCPVAAATTNDDFTIRIEGPFVDDPSLPERLCVLANSRNNVGMPNARLTEWIHHLEAMLWPANPQPMFMLGHIDRVFDPDLTWTREAARVVMTASCAESGEMRLKATDALIDGFGQVRACPRLIGRQLHALGDSLTLKRSADVLTSVGQVSELHQRSVFDTIDEFIAQHNSAPRDLHFALTPMLEAALQSGEAVSENCRRVLETITGSSKTAKLAAQLLSVEPDPARQMIAGLQTATAAIERAERWSSLAADVP
ncbi:MAG: DUF6493 family protein [Planctomycetaceae bacterium]